MNQDTSIIPSEWWLPIIAVAWLSLFLMIMWDRRKDRRQLKVFRNGDWVPISDLRPNSKFDPTLIHRRPVSNFYDQADYDMMVSNPNSLKRMPMKEEDDISDLLGVENLPTAVKENNR